MSQVLDPIDIFADMEMLEAIRREYMAHRYVGTDPRLLPEVDVDYVAMSRRSWKRFLKLGAYESFLRDEPATRLFGLDCLIDDTMPVGTWRLRRWAAA